MIKATFSERNNQTGRAHWQVKMSNLPATLKRWRCVMEKQRVTFKTLRFKKVSRQVYDVFFKGVRNTFGNRKSARKFYQQKKLELQKVGAQ